jgi:hypothetical protein
MDDQIFLTNHGRVHWLPSNFSQVKFMVVGGLGLKADEF